MYYIMHKQLNKDMCADNTMVCFTGWDGGGDVYVCGRGVMVAKKFDPFQHHVFIVSDPTWLILFDLICCL